MSRPKMLTALLGFTRIQITFIRITLMADLPEISQQNINRANMTYAALTLSCTVFNALMIFKPIWIKGDGWEGVNYNATALMYLIPFILWILYSLWHEKRYGTACWKEFAFFICIYSAFSMFVSVYFWGCDRVFVDFGDTPFAFFAGRGDICL
jgi:hypothetical protein